MQKFLRKPERLVQMSLGCRAVGISLLASVAINLLPAALVWSSCQPVSSGELPCSCWFSCLVKTFLLVCRENGLTPSNTVSAYTEGKHCLVGYACLISFVWISSGSSTQVLEFLRECVTNDDFKVALSLSKESQSAGALVGIKKFALHQTWESRWQAVLKKTLWPL